MRKPIIWIDDEATAVEEFRSQWIMQGLKHTPLTFIALADFLDEDGVCLRKILENKPSAIILDWQGGIDTGLYKLLKDNINKIIIASRASFQLIGEQLHPLLEIDPGLKNRLLTKPFTIKQLISLIGSSMPANWEESPTEASLALRYLDENLEPIGKSSGWVIDLNRPTMVWKETERMNVVRGRVISHNIFSLSPVQPNSFGPIQVVTSRLVEPIGDAIYIQQAVELPDEGISLAKMGRSIDGIIHLMKEAGFKRGRYYHLSEISGIDGYVLEMIARAPSSSGTLELPASTPLDKEEFKTYTEFCEKNQNEPNKKLHYKVTAPGLHGKGANADFWANAINMDGIKNVLRVPVFLLEKEKNDRKILRGFEALRGLRGEFIFDKDTDGIIDNEKDISLIEAPLMAAINYFHKAREEEREHFDAGVNRLLVVFQGIIFPMRDIDSVVDNLVQYVIKAAQFSYENSVLKAKKVKRSALYARFDNMTKSLHVIYEAYMDEEIVDFMTGLTFPVDHPACVEMPLIKCALSVLKAKEPKNVYQPKYQAHFKDPDSRRPAYEAAGADPNRITKIIERLGKEIKALAAYPVVVQNNLLGVVVLRSEHEYEFSSRTVESVQRVIDVATPHLARLQEAEHTRHWNGILMHEMRATLSWAKRQAAEVKKDNDLETAQKRVEEAMMILDGGITLSSVFLKWLNQNEIISKEEQRNRDTAKEFWQRQIKFGNFMAKGSGRTASWQYHVASELLANEPAYQGKHAVYLERIIRIYLDNAFRYGLRAEEVIWTVVINKAQGWLEIEIINQIDDNSDLVDANVHTINSEEIIASKATIGLQMAAMLCREAQTSPPTINTSQGKGGDSREFAVRFNWPYVKGEKP